MDAMEFIRKRKQLEQELEQKENKTYGDDVMHALRGRMGLNPDDTSKDNEIMKLDREYVFREYCYHHGLTGTFYLDILDTVADIYGVSLQG